MMEAKWKKWLKAYPFCRLAFAEYHRLVGAAEARRFTDYEFIKRKYEAMGHSLNLMNPTRYTEKLQWLKLFYRDERIPICSNKLSVRKYLTDLGYGGLLNDLIAVYDDVEHFSLENLPNRFVLKGAHGSGWNLIVKDKTAVPWFWWKKIMRSWLRTDLSWFGREWNYHDSKRCIVVEKYLEDDSGELRDFKIFCFNGEPHFVQVDENRFSNHRRVYWDCEGNDTGMHDTHNHGDKVQVTFTATQRKMIELARELSRPFPSVRVDFYSCNDRIIFGELTFFDGSGFYSFNPDEWDFKWGELLTLPQPNFNLDLLAHLQTVQ